MADITVTGQESYFNENAKFFKDVNIYGELISTGNIESTGNVEIGGRLNVTKDVNIENNIEISGNIYSKGSIFTEGPATFSNGLFVSGISTFSNDVYFNQNVLIEGSLEVYENFSVGVGGTIFNIDYLSRKVGIGSVVPQQKLDVSGSVKIDKDIYDSLNNPGPVGGFLTKDAEGIKWVEFEPSFTEGIFVYNNGVLIGIGSYRGLNIVSGLNTTGTSTDSFQAYTSNLSQNISDLVVTDYWGFNTQNQIYRFSNVGINTSNPTVSLSVIGSGYFSGSLVLESTLQVSGPTTLYSGLEVDGSTELNSNLDVYGVTRLFNSLAVGGLTILGSSLEVNGDTNLNSALDVDGNVTFNSVTDSTNKDTGSVIIQGGIGIEKNTNIGGILKVENLLNSTGTSNGSVVIDGGVGIDKNLNIGGSLVVFSASTFGSSLRVNGETTLETNLGVAGDSIFGRTVRVDGNTTLNLDLSVGGFSYFYNDLYGYGPAYLYNSLYVGGQTQIGNNLEVFGTGYFEGDTFINGLLTVNGPAIVNSTLDVNEISNFNSTINVNGSANINSDLNVSGLSTFVGLTTFSNDVYIGGDLYIKDDLVFDEFRARNAILTGNINVVGLSTFNATNISRLNVSGVSTFLSRIDVGTGRTVIAVTESGTIGFGMTNPSREIDFNRDIRLRQGLYDTNNNVGYKSEFYQTPRSVLTTVGINSQGEFIGGRFFDAANMIRLNLDFIAEESVGYILSTDYKNPTFTLSSGDYTSCKDDIKDIFKAITIDLTKGGNFQSVGAGLSYYNGNTLVHIIGTDINGYSIKEASIAAIGAASTIARYVINNAIIPKSYQPIPISGVTSVRQIRDLTLQDDPNVGFNTDPFGCANVASAIHTYAGIVTTIIGRGPEFAPKITEPDGKVIWAPSGADSKNTIWVSKYGNDDNGGRTEGDSKLTIASAVEIAEPGDTIVVRPGVYYENNPIGLRRDVAISGQDLRLVTVVPLNLGKDVFHVRRGCLIENMNFNLESGQQNIGGAVVAFPPTPEDVLVGVAYTTVSGYIAPGPADEGPSGRWRSPYVRNCTNFMNRSIGMKVDGNHATGSTIGADLKCMVLDSFTQYNEAGIGVSVTNSGYAQLVSLFTIACDKAVYVDTGGQCDLTNSNSSFGNYGLYADGLGPLEFSAELQQGVDQESDTFYFRNVSDKFNNPRRPYDGQSLYFKVLINGIPIEEPFQQLESVIVTNGGSGYSSGSPPNVIVRDADGTIQPKGLEGIVAEVSPTIDDVTGQMIAIDVINSGRNYLSDQEIIIDIEGNGGAVAVAKLSPIYYTVNAATIPSEPNGRYADAVNLIMRNKDFIATEAVDRMLYYYNVTLGLPFSVPTGSQSCVDDIKLVLNSIAYNLQFGGNDKTYDAASVYYSNPYLDGEENQSIYAYHVARDLAKSVINNVTITKQNYTNINDFTQIFDYTLIADPLTGSNIDPLSCSDVRSTIDNLVGIVTFAIRPINPTLPVSRTIGNTVGLSTVTLNEFVPYPIGVGVSIEVFKISRILTSGHSFEFIGSGTDINTATPQKGGVPIKSNEVVAINGAQIPFTSTDQAGNFNIGGGIQISQTTSSISGRDFNRSIQAQVTPLILALS